MITCKTILMKINELINNIKLKLEYNSCYARHEYDCKAIFGLCQSCDDRLCPYNVDNVSQVEDKK